MSKEETSERDPIISCVREKEEGDATTIHHKTMHFDHGPFLASPVMVAVAKHLFD